MTNQLALVLALALFGLGQTWALQHQFQPQPRPNGHLAIKNHDTRDQYHRHLDNQLFHHQQHLNLAGQQTAHGDRQLIHHLQQHHHHGVGAQFAAIPPAEVAPRALVEHDLDPELRQTQQQLDRIFALAADVALVPRISNQTERQAQQSKSSAQAAKKLTNKVKERIEGSASNGSNSLSHRPDRHQARPLGLASSTSTTTEVTSTRASEEVSTPAATGSETMSNDTSIGFDPEPIPSSSQKPTVTRATKTQSTRQIIVQRPLAPPPLSPRHLSSPTSSLEMNENEMVTRPTRDEAPKIDPEGFSSAAVIRGRQSSPSLPATAPVESTPRNELSPPSSFRNERARSNRDESDHVPSSIDKLRSPNIKVVFNNNPHFIIGREHVHSSLSSREDSDFGPINRRSGRPHEDYSSDESSPSEVKVSRPDEDVPCKKDKLANVQKQISLPSNFDQIDLKDTDAKQASAPVKPQSPAPPLVEAQQKADKTDPIVDTPFDQIVKGGLRPPLRMVVSMRNKEGHMMRVPINLHGSAPMLPVDKQSGASLDQMQLHLEPKLDIPQSQEDLNTPPGGDLFDPGLVKPFPKKNRQESLVPRSKDEDLKRQLDAPIIKPSIQAETSKVPIVPVQSQNQLSDSQVDSSAKQSNCNDKEQKVSTQGLPDTVKQVKQERGKADEPDETPMVLPPIGNNGLVHLMMPQLTPFHNKTLADMFSQFQKALGEQMEQHLAQQTSSNQRHQDDQEDLMVAMMAANMTANGPQSPIGLDVAGEQRQLSMTVIRPPKGTSLQDAIRVHTMQANPDQTVAILHSSHPDPVSVQPTPVEVQLKPAGRPNPNPLSESEIDPDGFSVSASHKSTSNKQQQSFLRLIRRRRSLDQIRKHHLDEPDADRLAGRQHSAGASSRFNHFDNDPLSSAASEMSSSSDDESDSDDDDDENDTADTNDVPSSYGDGNASGDADMGSNELADDADENSPDDEPFNQGASSERDYNSPSFEIPQIDINPNTLKQKGCRTVLREVQEIPMDGLGVVQANGQPGSGYVRVRRHLATGSGASGPNSINSRKVTSIVMTKECHFPNEPSDTDKSKAQVQAARSGPVATKPVVLAGARPSLATGKQPEVVKQNSMASGLPPVHLAPKPLVSFSQQPLIDRARLQVADRSRLSAQDKSAQALKQQPQWTLHLMTPKPELVSSRLGVPQSVLATTSQPEASRLNAIKRRSVASGGGKHAHVDDHVGADSRRNEVVAQKLYKPPSKDDPFHTLSYSSKNGNDPDMDQDDDDQAVMDADEDDAGRPGLSGSSSASRARLAPSWSNGNRPAPEERRALSDSNHDDTDPPPRPVRRRTDWDGEQDSDFASDESRALGVDRRRAGAMRPAGAEQPSRFGKNLKVEHSIERPQMRAGLMSQLSRLHPAAKQGFVTVPAKGSALVGQASLRPPAAPSKVKVSAQRRNDQTDAPDQADDSDEAPDSDAPDAADSADETDEQPERRAHNQSDDPDLDPDYNPKESRVPASTKPKRVEKSFAYVHRDLPRKGTKNPDDFAVSYGRGNLQTEQEDYDSDRDNNGGAKPSGVAASARLPVVVGRPAWPLRKQVPPTG